MHARAFDLDLQPARLRWRTTVPLPERPHIRRQRVQLLFQLAPPERAGGQQGPRAQALVQVRGLATERGGEHLLLQRVLAEAATGVAPFARAWLRAGTVYIDGAKMAKSAGNLVLVDDLLREHSPAAIRLLCLNRPWSAPWEFTPDALAAAAATLDELYAAAARTGSDAGAEQILEALRENLDVPRALAIALAEGGAAARALVEILALS